jgi:antitoxin (DNA-binding transcriptional repressor) of toxin-antitoxin stability system
MPPEGSRRAVPMANVATRSNIASMRTVSIRELKNRLSEYLRQVRSGESVLVTDRGEVIAELSPPASPAIDVGVPPGVAALARRGLVTLGVSGKVRLYPEPPRGRRRCYRASQLLNEERATR